MILCCLPKTDPPKAWQGISFCLFVPSRMNVDDAGDGEDKLRHGPCSKLYIDLEECATKYSKTIRSHSVSESCGEQY